MRIVDSVPLSEAGRIIILNGASSSGKTSLSRAMQSQLPQPYQHLQLDAFRSMEPPSYWKDLEKQPPETAARQLAALCRSMNAAIATYSRHGTVRHFRHGIYQSGIVALRTRGSCASACLPCWRNLRRARTQSTRKSARRPRAWSRRTAI